MSHSFLDPLRAAAAKRSLTLAQERSQGTICAPKSLCVPMAATDGQIGMSFDVAHAPTRSVEVIDQELTSLQLLDSLITTVKDTIEKGSEYL